MRRKSRASWPVAYRWIAMGTFVVYTAVGTRTITLANAQEISTASAAQGDALVVRRFDIAPAMLDVVLSEFKTVTGMQIELQSPGINDLNSAGVRGQYTIEQALRNILKDTGVTYRFEAGKKILLEIRGPASTVEVTDTAPVLSSPKYTQPLRDTPQTIMVIPKAVIEEQGATTLRDVLRNVPGLTVTAGEGGAPAGDNLTLRGFSARNDIFVDGVRDLSVQSRDPFNMEQVEVTKGPTSAFSGRGSTGGTINLISKYPSLRKAFGGALNFGSDGTKRVSGDINLPLPKRMAFRLNAMFHDSGVAGRDVINNQRYGVAPSLTFGLGTPTRLTLGYFKLKQDNISDYGIPWVPATNNALAEFRDKPAPVPRQTFYGYRTRDIETTGADLGTVRFEHDFTDGVDFRSQLRYARSTRNSMATPPRFASNDSTIINREMRSWIVEDEIWDNQTDLRARFRTGGIEHSLVTGFNLNNENNIRTNRTAPNAPTTLLNPNPDDVYTGEITTSPYIGDVTGNTQAVYLFDTAKFGRHWEAMGGLRWERFDVDGVTTAPAPVSRVDSMNSVRAGITYKPVERGSIYASYGTSMNPSLEGLSIAPANAFIEPEKTYTAEVGAKWDVAHDRLLLAGALFRIDKTNARTPGVLPDDPPQVLDGRQRANGFELSATGGISTRLKIFAAYTYIDGKIIESNNPVEVGKYFQNTPKNSFSVWSTYQIRKLSVGGGPRFMDKRYGNNTNTRFVEKYWTLDALASYPVHSKMDLRINVYNLNNAYYFDRLGGGHVVPGAARSVMVSTAFHF